MGLFDSIGKIVSNVGSGIGSFVSTASSFADKLNPLSQIAQGIGGLFDNKDSGNFSASPTFALDTNPTQYQPPPVVANTTGLGTNASNFTDFMGASFTNNQGSGGSLIPRPPFENQNAIVETSQSSLGSLFQAAPNIIGLGTQIAKRTAPFFGFGSGQTLKQPFDIPQIGEIIEDDNQTVYAPSIGDLMAYGVGGQGALTIPQAMPMQSGTAFMSPVLGRIGISSKGNIIITRKLRNQFKALADNVGLAQASNIAGVPLEIGAMILTKRFPSRSKSISTKKMRDCARTYKQVMQCANMIPK
jgi:hypothetical protein